ncbi:MAG TPA: TetR/AcrR family transcriptional regulator [Nakamurella sp.]
MNAAADTPSGPSSYHHPDLRSVLLKEGIALARAGGPEAVSLRDVQRRAGVSNSAAYRHYADRAALLDAISDWANSDLSARMRAALDAVAPAHGQDRRVATARDRVRALGHVYVAYALQEPGLFATAFIDTRKAPGTHEHADAPYALLGRCLDELVEAGALDPARRAWSDVAAWSAVHGLAVLLRGGPLRELGPADRDAAIERVLDVMLTGLT